MTNPPEGPGRESNGSVMKRVGLACLSIGALYLLFGVGGGASSTVNDVNGVGSVSANTSPASLGAAVIIILAFLVAIESEGPVAAGATAGAGRRFVAWVLDFLLSLGALSSILALIPLAAEAHVVGHFEWEFTRSEIAPRDWTLSLLVVALTFGGMAFYWALPVVSGGQTIGQSISGIRVVSVTDARPSLGLTLLRGVMQPFAMLLWFGKLVSGRYWQDEVAKVKVVLDRAGQ